MEDYKYTKKQLVEGDVPGMSPDVLAVVLDDDLTYTMSEVEKLYSKFLNSKEVK